ncbi:MAG: glycosyltransferase [Alphaproteobacteria bacterium]|jgi:putative colanic acid biosynthesis glycosyltransferase|nr:glycosyltransferase [Alphaproteobacteria bacterium]
MSLDDAQPWLAVLTVCRQDRAGLARTHEGLAAQSRRDFAWLVQDGGSTDGTPDLLEALRDPAPDWQSIADGGPFDGMNRLLARAAGRFVLFLNAGDTPADAGTFARLAAALAEAPEPDLLYGDAWEETPAGWALKRARSHRRAWAGLFTHHQAIVYRRALVADLRYPTEYRIAADYAFTLDALARAALIRRVEWPVCRFAAGGLSQRLARLGRREQALVRREKLGIPMPVDALITSGQAASLALRRYLPGLYARLRYRGR